MLRRHFTLSAIGLYDPGEVGSDEAPLIKSVETQVNNIEEVLTRQELLGGSPQSMIISSEEIVGRPDGLFVQELWRPSLTTLLTRNDSSFAYTAIEILWVAKEYPRCRSARSGSIRLIRETALAELESIREWWTTVEHLWERGKCMLVIHDGESSDDEINLWIDLNLVAPWFKEVLDQDLSLEEIKLMTEWHKISRSPE